MNEPQPQTVFYPAYDIGVIRKRIRAAFVAMLPQEEIDRVVRKEINGLLKPRGRQLGLSDMIRGAVGEIRAKLPHMIHAEVSEVLAATIQSALHSRALYGERVAIRRQVERAMKTYVKKLKPRKGAKK